MNSKSINEIQDEILEEFEPFDDWMDKYSLLIDMGNTLLPLEDSEKTPEHIIEGCQSRVWIVTPSLSRGLQPYCSVCMMGNDPKILYRRSYTLLIEWGFVSIYLLHVAMDSWP